MPAVRLPPDHADGLLAVAVPARGGVADRRDLDPAPPTRRPATAAAAPPEPELGGPALLAALPDVIPKARYQEPRLLVNTRHDPALAPPGRHSAGCLARSGGSAGTSVAVCGGSLPGRCGCQPACPLPGRSRSPRRHAAAPPAAAPPRVPPPVPSRHPTVATPAHRTSSLLRLGHQARTIAPGGRLVSTAYSRNVCLPGLSYYWARRGHCWSRRPDQPGPGAARAAGPCSGPG